MRLRETVAALLGGLLLATGALTGGCGPSDSSAAPESATINKEDAAIAVAVTPVERRPMSRFYETSTTLRADKRATVIARTGGVIEKTLAEEGDQVEAGAPLAILEDDEQRLNFEIARGKLETAERELARAERLAERKLISEEELDSKRRAAEEARRNADLARLALERTVIRAPFSGWIVTRHLDVGATVSNGTAVYDIADTDPLYADIRVPERLVGSLEPGQEARLSSEASKAAARGRVVRIARAVDPESGTVKVTITVPPAAGLMPGSFARVAVVLDTHANALVVPRKALVADGDRLRLYRLAADGEHVEELEVATGYEEGDLVEILPIRAANAAGGAAELAPGDRVVTSGASALSDGARVILPQASAGATAAADREPGASRVAS